MKGVDKQIALVCCEKQRMKTAEKCPTREDFKVSLGVAGLHYTPCTYSPALVLPSALHSTNTGGAIYYHAAVYCASTLNQEIRESLII